MADLADVRFLHSRRFYQQFWLFALYFIISLVCFTMRPILVPDAEPAVATPASAGLVVDVTTYETPLSTAYPAPTNVNGSPPSLSASSPEPPPPLLAPGLTLMTDADVAESGADDLQLAGAEQATPTDSGEVEVNASRYDQDACYLSKVRWMDLFFSIGYRRSMVVLLFFFFYIQYETLHDYIRMGAEIGVVLGAVVYLFDAAREASFLGKHMFFENLVRFAS